MKIMDVISRETNMPLPKPLSEEGKSGAYRALNSVIAMMLTSGVSANEIRRMTDQTLNILERLK